MCVFLHIDIFSWVNVRLPPFYFFLFSFRECTQNIFFQVSIMLILAPTEALHFPIGTVDCRTSGSCGDGTFASSLWCSHWQRSSWKDVLYMKNPKHSKEESECDQNQLNCLLTYYYRLE